MKATKVTAGLAESNGSLPLGLWRDSLHVTCGLTACTPGSAAGPTLGNEYLKTLSFYLSDMHGQPSQQFIIIIIIITETSKAPLTGAQRRRTVHDNTKTKRTC